MFRFIFFIIFNIDFVVKVYGNPAANVDDYMVQDLQEVAYDMNKFKRDNIPQNGAKDVSDDKDKDKDKQDNIQQNGARDVSDDKDKDKQDNIPQNGAKDVSYDKNKDKDKQHSTPQNGVKDVSYDKDKDKQDSTPQNGAKDVSYDKNKDKQDNIPQNGAKDVSEDKDKDKQDNIPQNSTTNATQTNKMSKESSETTTNATTPESDEDKSYYEVPRDQSHENEPDFKPIDEIKNLTNAELYSIIIDKKLFNEMIKKQIKFMYGGPHKEKYQYVGNLLWIYIRSKVGERIVTVTMTTPKNRYAHMNVSTLPPLSDYYGGLDNFSSSEIQQQNQSQKNSTEETEFSTIVKPKTNETVDESTTTNLPEQKESTHKTEFLTAQESQLTPTEQNDKNVIRQGMNYPVDPSYYDMDAISGPGGYLPPSEDYLIIGITTPVLHSTEHPVVKDPKTKNMHLGYQRRIGNLDNRSFGKGYKKKNSGGGGFDKDARRKYDKKGKGTIFFNKLNNKERNKVILKELIENVKAMEAIKKYDTKIVQTTAKYWPNFYKIHGKTSSFGRTANFHETQLKNNKKSNNLDKKTQNFENKKGKMVDLNDGNFKYKLKTKQKTKMKNIESRNNNIHSEMDTETDGDYRLTSESESIPKTHENKMDKHKIRNYLKYKQTKLYKSFKKRHEINEKRRMNVKNKISRKNLGQKKLSVLKKHQKVSSVDVKTRPKDNERSPNAYKRQYNDESRRPSDNKRPYDSKIRPPSANIRLAGVSRRPPDDNQLSMYLTPQYEFNSRRFNDNFNLTRRSNAKSISTELSYSYKEYDIKFHIQDAIRHPIDFKSKIQQNSLIFEKVQNVRRQMAPVDKISLREESSYSDDEGIIKNNLYKAFKKNN